MHEIFSQKERVYLTWARRVWSWASEMRSQLQLQSNFSEIEDQMQQATQQAKSERAQIQSQLEQLKQGQLHLQSRLSEVLSLVEPLRQLRLFDPRELQLQLLQIEAQLRQAQQERSHLQSHLSEVTERLETSNKERTQDVVTQSQLWQLQLSDIQVKLQQQAEQQQKQLETLSSDLRSSIPKPEKTESEKAQRQPKPQDELISAVDKNFIRLQELLAAGEWKDADKETASVILRVAVRNIEGSLKPEDIANFPCTVLRIIDQLWVKYSQNRFGFSVQKRIWLGSEGTLNANYETYCRFGALVGWCVKDSWLSYFQLTFSLDAPVGHLPGWGWWGRDKWGFGLGWSYLSKPDL